MTTINPADAIKALEEEARELEKNHAQAMQVTRNCETRAVQLEAEIKIHKQYLPEEETVADAPADFNETE
tara:strand:- start:786 stop:995 length:210 start_codon:yes stop_codon:yes gene_type:complete